MVELLRINDSLDRECLWRKKILYEFMVKKKNEILIIAMHIAL